MSSEKQATASAVAPDANTPVPWRVDHDYRTDEWNIRSGGFYVAKTFGGLGYDDEQGPPRANAEFIVHACNVHGELVSALKAVLRGFDEGVWNRNIQGDGDPAWGVKLLPHVLALAAAQKAIQKAEGATGEITAVRHATPCEESE